MKFKLDENLPVELAHDLRILGQEADTAADENPVSWLRKESE